MTSSSSSPSNSGVFVNFRHKDTGNYFTSYLCAALRREGIRISISEERKKRRAATVSEIKKAIEESKVSVVIFSRLYAECELCLDELVMIIERIKTNGQIVIPVFYHVNPNDVEEVSGTFGEGFEKLAKKFPERKVKEWRAALRKSVHLCGREVSPNEYFSFRHEDKAVNDIVRSVSEPLSHLRFRNPKGLI